MIQSKRIRLRLPDTPDDHRLLVDWRNDPTMKPYFYDDEPVSMESHLRWWETVSADPTQRFYMIEAATIGIKTVDYVPIGTTSLLNIDWRNRTAEYGRLKIAPPYQGKGYGLEVEYLLMAHAFNFLNLNRVWGHVLANNEQVLRLHAKVGFVQEGCLRGHIYKAGHYMDVVTIGLLAEDFRRMEMRE